MKKTILILFIALSACNNQQSTDKQKKLIADFLQQDAKGVKTDLKIKVSKLDISNIHVSDSITTLKKRFKDKKAAKIKSAKSEVASSKKSLEEKQKKLKSNPQKTSKQRSDYAVNNAMMGLTRDGLEKAQKRLKEAKNWRPDYLKRYDASNHNKLLVKKAVTTFSFFNPKLQTRQERTETFILSKEGNQVLGMMYKGKFRHKE